LYWANLDWVNLDWAKDHRPVKDNCFRWQLTRGLRDKAAKTIREIATDNKKPIPNELEKRLGMCIKTTFKQMYL